MEQAGSEYILKVEPTKFPSGHSCSLAGTAGRMKLTSTEMGKMVEKTGCGVWVSNSLQGAGGGGTELESGPARCQESTTP